MKRLSEALSTLDQAVDLLEDSVAGQLAKAQRPSRAAKSGRAAAADSLFSDGELSSVKQRLDEAIERLESALESADGPR